MKNKRIEYIDLAKGVGIILVLLGHTFFLPEYIRGYIYSFHMPLFFALSGLVFNGDYPFKAFVTKKAKTLLVPFATVITLYIIYFNLVSLITKGYSDFFKLFFGLLFQQYGFIYAPWFFVVLFFTEILFYAFYKASKGRLSVIIALSALVLFLGIVYFKTINLHLVWQVQILFTSIPFFCFGYLLKRSNLPSKLNRPYFAVIFFSISIALFAVKCYYFKPYTSLTTNTYPNFALFYTLAISAILSVISFSAVFNNIKPVNYLGQNTVVLFSLQQVLVSKTLKLVLKTNFPAEVLNSVSFLQGLLLSLAEFAVTLIILLAVNHLIKKSKHLSKAFGKI